MLCRNVQWQHLFWWIIVTIILLVSSGALRNYWGISRRLHEFTRGPVWTYLWLTVDLLRLAWISPGTAPLNPWVRHLESAFIYLLFSLQDRLRCHSSFGSPAVFLLPGLTHHDLSWGRLCGLFNRPALAFLRWLPVCCCWRLFFFFFLLFLCCAP